MKNSIISNINNNVVHYITYLCAVTNNLKFRKEKITFFRNHKKILFVLI
jgi:hypothetical protein